MKHAGTQTITTERLILRRFELDDAETMYRNWASDPEITRYMRWMPHKDADETRRVIGDWFGGYVDDKKYHWGICLKSDGELIGSIGVVNLAEHDMKAETGYCIGRMWHNNGYVTEALKAVIDYMFTHTDLNRIEAYHSTANPQSGRVMAKAGMIKEGFARQYYKNNDGYQDSDLYGIIRNNWEENKNV